MKKLGDLCVLEDRLCTKCGECNLCDLEPNKTCDNCCQCIKTLEGDYAEIEINDILLSTEEKTMGNHQNKGPSRTYKINKMSNHILTK